MVVHTSFAGPQRQSVVAVGPDVAVEDDGARGTSIDSHLVGRVAGLHLRTIVIIDGQTTDDAVVGTFLQHHDTVMHGLSVIFFNSPRGLRLGLHNNGAVTLFTHQHDVGTVNDDLLLISTLADEYLKRLFRLFRCLFNGSLNTFTGIDHCIKVLQVLLRLAEHVNQPVLVGSLCLEADSNLVLRVVPVGPLLIERIELGRTVAEPRIAIATLLSDVL